MFKNGFINDQNRLKIGPNSVTQHNISDFYRLLNLFEYLPGINI